MVKTPGSPGEALVRNISGIRFIDLAFKKN